MTEPWKSLAEFRVVADGLDHPECVACGPDGTLYAGGEAGQVYRLDDGVEEVGSTGGFSLGLCLDAGHNIYVCDRHHAAVVRMAPDGDTKLYSDGTADRRMRTPNHLVFAGDGTLFVSDSGDWEADDGVVWAVEPGGEASILTTEAAAYPNGVALAPDATYLYIVLSLGPSVARLPLRDGRAAGPLETFVELPGHVPDGVAFDVDGTLFVSCYAPDRLLAVDPGGGVETVADDWRRVVLASPTNIAFYGADRRTLAVASLCRWHVAATTMPVAGAPLHYPVVP